MNTNKKVLMTMLAVIVIAANTFTGCNKPEVIEVTGVSLCPIAIMIYEDAPGYMLNSAITFYPTYGIPDWGRTWTSSHPNIVAVEKVGSDSIGTARVTPKAIGESVITCKTNDGGYTASTTVIVNPRETQYNFASMVPGFYIGNTKAINYIEGIPDEVVDLNKLVTVKYHSENKIVYSIDEVIKLPKNVDCTIKVNEITAISELGSVPGSGIYITDFTTNVIIEEKPYTATIKGEFREGGKLILNIHVANPRLGDFFITFTALETIYVLDCK